MIDIIESSALEAISSAILHSLWQGLIILSLNYMVIKVGWVKRPEVKYLIQVGSMVILFLLFVISFVASWELPEYTYSGGDGITPISTSATTVPIELNTTGLSIRTIVGYLWMTGVLLFSMRKPSC